MATAVNSKLSNVKQSIIATEEVVINDVSMTARNYLTRTATQDEINKMSGAYVSTRGRYLTPEEKDSLQPNPPSSQRPLYLHIQGTNQQDVKVAVGRIMHIILEHNSTSKRPLPFGHSQAQGSGKYSKKNRQNNNKGSRPSHKFNFNKKGQEGDSNCSSETKWSKKALVGDHGKRHVLDRLGPPIERMDQEDIKKADKFNSNSEGNKGHNNYQNSAMLNSDNSSGRIDLPSMNIPPPNMTQKDHSTDANKSSLLLREKVFLPEVSSISTQELVKSLIGEGGSNLQFIRESTGVRLLLKGMGSGSALSTIEEKEDPLHFYLEHNDEAKFNEAKSLVSSLAQTVITELHNAKLELQLKHLQAVSQQPPNVLLPPNNNVTSSNIQLPDLSHLQVIQDHSQPMNHSGLLPPHSSINTSLPPPPISVNTSLPPPPLSSLLPPPSLVNKTGGVIRYPPPLTTFQGEALITVPPPAVHNRFPPNSYSNHVLVASQQEPIATPIALQTVSTPLAPHSIASSMMPQTFGAPVMPQTVVTPIAHHSLPTHHTMEAPIVTPSLATPYVPLISHSLANSIAIMTQSIAAPTVTYSIASHSVHQPSANQVNADTVSQQSIGAPILSGAIDGSHQVLMVNAPPQPVPPVDPSLLTSSLISSKTSTHSVAPTNQLLSNSQTVRVASSSASESVGAIVSKPSDKMGYNYVAGDVHHEEKLKEANVFTGNGNSSEVTDNSVKSAVDAITHQLTMPPPAYSSSPQVTSLQPSSSIPLHTSLPSQTQTIQFLIPQQAEAVQQLTTQHHNYQQQLHTIVPPHNYHIQPQEVQQQHNIQVEGRPLQQPEAAPLQTQQHVVIHFTSQQPPITATAEEQVVRDDRQQVIYQLQQPQEQQVLQTQQLQTHHHTHIVDQPNVPVTGLEVQPTYQYQDIPKSATQQITLPVVTNKSYQTLSNEYYEHNLNTTADHLQVHQTVQNKLSEATSVVSYQENSHPISSAMSLTQSVAASASQVYSNYDTGLPKDYSMHIKEEAENFRYAREMSRSEHLQRNVRPQQSWRQYLPRHYVGEGNPQGEAWSSYMPYESKTDRDGCASPIKDWFISGGKVHQKERNPPPINATSSDASYKTEKLSSMPTAVDSPQVPPAPIISAKGKALQKMVEASTKSHASGETKKSNPLYPFGSVGPIKGRKF